MKQQKEYEVQAAFVRAMSLKYPGVPVFSDTAAHIKKTMFQQVRANKLQSPGMKWPDTFIPQPSGEYAGLFIEFKAQSPFKKDGVTLLKNEHVEAQAKTLHDLHGRGYAVCFAWTVAQAVEIVRDYLNGEKIHFTYERN